MSYSDITDFFRNVAQNPGLKKQVQAALDDRAEAAAFEIVKIAGEKGCEFSATELRNYLADEEATEGELSDEQLSAVAGGVRYLRRADLTGLRGIGTLSLSKIRARRSSDRFLG